MPHGPATLLCQTQWLPRRQLLVILKGLVNDFAVIAHRGLTQEAPGNTIESFRAAREAGADGVELDVRLTSDGVPVVHHNWYVNEGATEPSPIHRLSAAALRDEGVRHERSEWSGRYAIPTLAEVLEEFAGRLKLEVELKGPEPELVEAVVTLLRRFPNCWSSVEITSDMTSVLERVHAVAPQLGTALLIGGAPRYMRPDVIGYAAVQLARQAGVRLIHIQRAHLVAGVVDQLRAAGLTAHVYPVNDAEDVGTARRFCIPEVVTDELRRVLALRAATTMPTFDRHGS